MTISELTSQVTWGFDLKSPYSFFAFQFIQRYREFGVEFKYVPVSIVDLFKMANNTPPHEACDNKIYYLQQDIVNVSKWCQVPLKLPAHLGSINTKLALKCLLVIQLRYNEFFIPSLNNIWEGLFYHEKDIEQLEIIRELLPLDSNLIDQIILLAQSNEYSNKLIKNTQFINDKGGYGLPYFIASTSQGERTFFGMDRIPNLCSFISKSYSGPTPNALLSNSHQPFLGTITFAFDLLSPYGYFARKVLQRYEKLWNTKVDYLPVHMPTIFKESGNHGPIYGCGNKRNYTLQDLEYLPEFLKVDFKIPDKFPCNTIPGQTVLLLIKEQYPQCFIRAMDLLWDATLRDNQDIENFNVIQHCLQDLNIPIEELIQESKLTYHQQRILNLTRRAVQLGGAHGLPFITVNNTNSNQIQHFFGSDRLECLAYFLNQPYYGPNP